MHDIVNIIGLAIAVFIGANIDNFVGLIAFFSNSKFSNKKVIIGQYIAITLLILIGCIGYIFRMVLPIQWIGFLGLLPIILGVNEFIEYRKEKKESQNIDEIIEKISEKINEKQINIFQKGFRRISNATTALVALITFSNGVDDLGVFIPLFASFNLYELAITIIVFYMMLTIWCISIYFLVNNRPAAVLVKKYAKAFTPFVLIALGIFIITKCDTLSLFF